jgi:hypothetical protein
MKSQQSWNYSWKKDKHAQPMVLISKAANSNKQKMLDRIKALEEETAELKSLVNKE